ncbi:hypothetical protein GCM10027592_11210 [Spirosoma flavus]
MLIPKESQAARVGILTLRSKKFFYCLLLVIATYRNTLAQEQPKLHSETTPLPVQLNLNVYILYFDQSSYMLRPGVKITLDSIAQQLVNQPKLMASVTGHSDTIGNRELNRQLAERRAKTVENYLRQHGVALSRIKATWEAPDTKVSTTDAKLISRRVMVLLSPKE